ncbi:hypothetical protein DL95DRAFT_403022 [Leptodontidium sp. 2 PMI_412]|nr:hypothetical protein DL95DRAFT_403022 [Leptodontidium sp. 2 PMI_412]
MGDSWEGGLWDCRHENRPLLQNERASPCEITGFIALRINTTSKRFAARRTLSDRNLIFASLAFSSFVDDKDEVLGICVHGTVGHFPLTSNGDGRIVRWAGPLLLFRPRNFLMPSHTPLEAIPESRGALSIALSPLWMTSNSPTQTSSIILLLVVCQQDASCSDTLSKHLCTLSQNPSLPATWFSTEGLPDSAK